MTYKPKHRITVACEGKEIDGWIEYEIASSMIEPADGFTMRRPFNPKAWDLLERDARVRVEVDGAPILDGFIDRRTKRTKEGTIEIGGRDRSGRLVQESAPRISYEGLELTEAIRRLADPWFTKVTLSDARNRSLRLGKKRSRIPAGTEPIIVKKTSGGNGRVQPGTMRWAIIEELASQAGYIVWSSADGRELFVGRPNVRQEASYAFHKGNVRDLIWDEDNGDRYSMIAVVGTGGGTERDHGLEVSSRRGVVFDTGEDGGPNGDGTGRDFKYAKRLLLPESHYTTELDASRGAAREQARRDFKRTTISIDVHYHGQETRTGMTLFATNTVASVFDTDFVPLRAQLAMIYACSYRRSRKDGETTLLELVPNDTEIIL